MSEGEEEEPPRGRRRQAKPPTPLRRAFLLNTYNDIRVLNPQIQYETLKKKKARNLVS